MTSTVFCTADGRFKPGSESLVDAMLARAQAARLVPTASAGKLALRFPAPVVYAPSASAAAEGRRTRSTRHGGFWGDEETASSVIWIARNGFAA